MSKRKHITFLDTACAKMEALNITREMVTKKAEIMANPHMFEAYCLQLETKFTEDYVSDWFITALHLCRPFAHPKFECRISVIAFNGVKIIAFNDMLVWYASRICMQTVGSTLAVLHGPVQ